MRSDQDLLQSVTAALNAGVVSLAQLGADPSGVLDLDAPGGLLRYAEILRPTFQKAIERNRRQGTLITSSLLALFLVAIALTIYQHLQGARLQLNFLIVPGLGIAAVWPMGIELAKSEMKAGNARKAIQLFQEAFSIGTQRATFQERVLYKQALLRATDEYYSDRYWWKVTENCDTLREEKHFRLEESEKIRVSTTELRAGNRQHAASLPSSTVVIDFIPPAKLTLFSKIKATSYFHVFDSDGNVDVLVEARSVDDLVKNDEFRATIDQLDNGHDLLLTGEVTARPELELPLRKFSKSSIWSASDLQKASVSLGTMARTKVAPSEVSIAILLPKDEAQLNNLGLDWADAQLNHARAAVDYLNRRAQGARVVTKSTNRVGVLGWATDLLGTDSKSAVLHSLENDKGVIILFAHGDREGIYTPEGQKITVDEVDLRGNKPIILLLSCEGGQHGPSVAGESLAKALEAKGATAVWSYGEKVDAREAATLAAKLMAELRDGKTALEAFRSLSRDPGVKAGPPVYLHVEYRRSVHAHS